MASREGGVLRGFQHAAALDAVGADFDAAAGAVNDGVHHLEVRQKDPWCVGRDVLTNPALFLGLTAPMNRGAANLAFAANFTTSCHDRLLRLKTEGGTVAKAAGGRKAYFGGYTATTRQKVR